MFIFRVTFMIRPTPIFPHFFWGWSTKTYSFVTKCQYHQYWCCPWYFYERSIWFGQKVTWVNSHKMFSTSGHLISIFPEVRFHRKRICKKITWVNPYKRFPLVRSDGFPSSGLAVLPHKNIHLWKRGYRLYPNNKNIHKRFDWWSK